MDEFSYSQKNVTMVATPGSGLRLLPAAQLSSLGVIPTLWPVKGEITGHFGERLDPFSGEGVFHAEMDIASHYGDDVRATADGISHRGGHWRAAGKRPSAIATVRFSPNPLSDVPRLAGQKAIAAWSRSRV